ncbi:MAG: polymer-forming cytoskeletal protein [Candidatus Rokubacteria bacterium]|nr:polymer-forming cytoskeletal protein [Candidatus Rokubacteria bacterium]
MLGRKAPQANGQVQETAGNGNGHSITLLTIVGEHAKMDGKFDIADSIQIECEVSGELNVGGKGDMVATGNVEIASTGRVSGSIRTDSLVISKGGFFNGNVVKIKDEASSKQVYLIDEKAAHAAARPRGDGRGIDGRGGRLPYAVEEDR